MSREATGERKNRAIYSATRSRKRSGKSVELSSFLRERVSMIYYNRDRFLLREILSVKIFIFFRPRRREIPDLHYRHISVLASHRSLCGRNFPFQARLSRYLAIQVKPCCPF